MPSRLSPIRQAVLAALAVFAAVGCAAPQGIETAVPRRAPAGEALAGLEPHLRPGTVIVFGELHGTVEAPALVSRAADLALDKGLELTVALELPRQEEPRVRTFLASAGEAADRTALLAGPFWRSSYQDGRGSEAMVRLLDDLRRHAAAGRSVRVVCFDLWGARAAVREPAMAEALAAAIAETPQDLTLALAGNAHARLGRGGMPGVSEPMAVQLARLLPEGTRLSTFKLTYSGGTAWICGRGAECGIGQFGGRDHGTAPQVTVSETPRNGFHGEVFLGEIHASPPAVPRPVSVTAPDDAAPDLHDAAAIRHRDRASPPPITMVSSASRPPVPLSGNWPQWMGPRGDGAIEPGLLPLGVSASLEVDWRRPIGRGYSSISISGRLALTLEADERGVWAVALDAAGGRELWRVALEDPSRPPDGPVEPPASTPATDGERVFAIHPAGRLFALDAADGARLWTRDLAREFGASPPSYGMSTSPMLAEGRLSVLAGGREGHNLMVFDPESGEVLASSGPAEQGSYSTPVTGVLAGEPQLIVPAGDRLYGLRPADGAQVWSHGGIPYPDRSPLVLPSGRVFAAYQEYAAMYQVAAGSRTARELWRSELLGNSYSPVVHYRGALYGLGSGQLLCLDAATGNARWRQRLGMGSLIRIDDHLAVFGTMSGRLHLVPASPAGFAETASLAVFPRGNHGATPPSFGAGRIFVRGSGEIAAVRLGL